MRESRTTRWSREPGRPGSGGCRRTAGCAPRARTPRHRRARASSTAPIVLRRHPPLGMNRTVGCGRCPRARIPRWFVPLCQDTSVLGAIQREALLARLRDNSRVAVSGPLCDAVVDRRDSVVLSDQSSAAVGGGPRAAGTATTTCLPMPCGRTWRGRSRDWYEINARVCSSGTSHGSCPSRSARRASARSVVVAVPAAHLIEGHHQLGAMTQIGQHSRGVPAVHHGVAERTTDRDPRVVPQPSQQSLTLDHPDTADPPGGAVNHLGILALGHQPATDSPVHPQRRMPAQDDRCCAGSMQVPVGVEVYAHVARSLLFDGRTLTLVDLAPSTIWSSTPASALGYLPTGAFLDQWARRAQHLARPGEYQVRGTLSLLDPDANLAGDAVLTLGNPRVTAAGLAYDAGVQQGLVPKRSGACVLSSNGTRPRHAPSVQRRTHRSITRSWPGEPAPPQSPQRIPSPRRCTRGRQVP